MKLTNIAGFDSIDEYVAHKIAKYQDCEKNFETLFEYMFSESENVMAEITDGYRIKKITYGQFKKKITDAAPTLSLALAELPQQSIVGLYMSNSMEWIQIFWEIIVCGYRPLLMNTGLPNAILENILKEHDVKAVISDEKIFSVKTVLAKDVVSPTDNAMESRPFGSEVFFMSSGTTSNVKLCAYTGENFFYQICSSARIIKECPAIKEHYKGELKQLTLLPFYHVFGFIAVYLWFGFFSRTFVFLKDLNPTTIQNTVKKHEVTHIFAVPMVWDKVYKATLKKVRSKGKKTYNKFSRAIKISNAVGPFGNSFAKTFLKEVREGLFGDSIKFLITGGGPLATPVFEFYNGIGYHLANGYGMTEIGITSVEYSSKQKILNTASIGIPFGYVEYKRDDETSELLVKGKARAARIIEGGVSRITDYDEWFHTSDLVAINGGRYYHQGRKDDLVIGLDGENLNPTLLEPQLKTPSCESVCLISDENGAPLLLGSVQGCFSEEKIKEIYASLDNALANAKLDRTVGKVYLTSDPLLEAGEFKLSRHKVRKKYLAGNYRIIERENIDKHISSILSELENEVIECFATALDIDSSEISPNAHFFHDLNGTSLDYFMLLEGVKEKYSLEIIETTKAQLFTVNDFCSYIKK